MPSLLTSAAVHAAVVGGVLWVSNRPPSIDLGEARATPYGYVRPQPMLVAELEPEPELEIEEPTDVVEPTLEPVLPEPEPFLEETFEQLPDWDNLALAPYAIRARPEPSDSVTVPADEPEEASSAVPESPVAQTEPETPPEEVALAEEAAPSSQAEEIGETSAEPDHCPRPTYPTLSVRRGEQGLVRCRLHIDEHGVVRHVELVDSSGYERLDQAALKALATWRFHPATRAGFAVATVIDHEVEFRLDDEGV